MSERDWVISIIGVVVGIAMSYTWQDICFWYKYRQVKKFAQKALIRWLKEHPLDKD